MLYHSISLSFLRTSLPFDVILYILFFGKLGVKHSTNAFCFNSLSALLMCERCTPDDFTIELGVFGPDKRTSRHSLLVRPCANEMMSHIRLWYRLFDNICCYHLVTKVYGSGNLMILLW